MSVYFDKSCLITEIYKDLLVKNADKNFTKCRVGPPPKRNFLFQT